MKNRQADGSSDRRWIALAEDGRYVTLGRATDLTPDEINRAEADLRSIGLRGYLAVLSGSPYAAESPEILLVRSLADADTKDFAAACETFRRHVCEKTIRQEDAT